MFESFLARLIGSRRGTPPPATHPPKSEAIAEQSFVELAVFKGSEFVVSGTPDARVEDLGDGRYVAVTTPAAMWSYGAQLLLGDGDLPKATDLLFRVDLWVDQGLVNVGVVGPDGEFIVHQTLSKIEGRTAASLTVRSDDEPRQVIVRNAGRHAAKVIIERVQVYRGTNALVGSALDDVQSFMPSKPIREAFAISSSRPTEIGSEPLVSLIMTVKDGLPYLGDALNSVSSQSYRNIELVVQDCLSTDGSSELIAKFDAVPVHTRREADGGIGDANNRALERSRGAIVGTIDSDNLLDPDAVARAVEHFAGHPKDAVVYGSVQMIAADGTNSNIFRPGPFDFLRLVACDLVLPWSTAFFNKAVCGPSLMLDQTLKTCVDYDTWLRLSHLSIAFMDQVQGSTRLSTMSMSCRPENYEQFCSDKIRALRNYAETCAHGPLSVALVRYGVVGIYCWAAESIKGHSPESTQLIGEFFDRARALDPASPRLVVAAQRLF